MGRNRMAGVVLAGALLLGLTGCETLKNAQLVEFGAEYWLAEPGGSVQSSDLGSIGDKVDLDSALDLDGEEVFVYHAAATVGPTTVEVRYIDLAFDGITTLVDGFEFGGQTYDPGDVVSSDLDTSVLQLRSQTDVYGWKMLRIGILGGLDLLTIDTDVVNETDLIVVREDFEEWIPVLGITAKAAIPLYGFEFFADGEIGGILEEISFGGYEGDYISSFVRVGIDIDEGFRLGAGYRSLEADYEDHNDDSEVDIGGFFGFLEIHF